MKLSFLWRLLAALALICFAGLSIIVLKLAVVNLFLLAAVIVTGLALLYAGWLIFTGTGRRLRIGVSLAVLSAIALIAEVGFLFARGDNWKTLLTALVLGAVYLLLVYVLRRQYWAQKRQYEQRMMEASHVTHPVLIINPKAGNGRAMKAGVDKLASKRGIEVIVTKKSDNIEGLAVKAVEQGADVLGVSGGDGTLGAVAKIAIEYDLPLVVLPGGTRCHFARDIGLDPSRIVDALEGFRGRERSVDVGVINGRIFLNNVSFGVYADIVDHPEYRNNKVATSRKVMQEILNGQRARYSLVFRDESDRTHMEAVQILVGVNRYQMFNLFELGHRERLDDGVLQVTAVTKLDDTTIRKLASPVTLRRGAVTPSWNFMQWTTEEFTVDSRNEQLVTGVDGEREEYMTPVKIAVLPKRLRLMVPAEGIRTRPKSAFSSNVLSELWHGVIGR